MSNPPPCAYRGGASSGPMYDDQGNVCSGVPMTAQKKLMFIIIFTILATVLLSLASFFAYRFYRSRRSQSRISVVPARPLSAWGNPMAMGGSGGSRASLALINSDSRSTRRGSSSHGGRSYSPAPSSPSHASQRLLPQGGEYPGSPSPKLAPNPRNSTHGLLTPTSPFDGEAFPVMHPDSRNQAPSPAPSSSESTPRQLPLPPAARQAGGPVNDNRRYSRISNDDRRTSAIMEHQQTPRSHPDPRSTEYGHISPASPPLLSPYSIPSAGEREALYGLYPNGGSSAENVEVLTSYASSQGHGEPPHSPGNRASYVDEIYQPQARYEQKRISFIPLVEGGGGDISAERRY